MDAEGDGSLNNCNEGVWCGKGYPLPGLVREAGDARSVVGSAFLECVDDLLFGYRDEVTCIGRGEGVRRVCGVSGFVGEPQDCKEVGFLCRLGDPYGDGLGRGGVFEGGDGCFPDSLVP